MMDSDGPGRRWLVQRKVRAPQEMMPGNSRALAFVK